jgi:hypothetical protein
MTGKKKLAIWLQPKVLRLVAGEAEGKSLKPLADNQLFS